MHISEGVLSAPVLLTGAAGAALGIALGLRRMDPAKLMNAALLSSAFFVASLIHVPLGPGSVHLILNGLLGLLLGWAVFPAIFAALILQAVLFQYGGITVLGVNTFNMALPAALFSMLFSPLLPRGSRARLFGAFCCGAMSVAGAGFLTALSLGFTDEGFIRAAQLLFVAHIPVMLLEGIVTALTVSFISRVRPEMLPLFRP
jgi:cobalt/nickel transport system permease protein